MWNGLLFPIYYHYPFCQWGWAAYLFSLSYNRDYLFFEHLAKCTYKTIWVWGFFEEEIFENCFNVCDAYFFIQVVYFSCLNLVFSYFSSIYPLCLNYWTYYHINFQNKALLLLIAIFLFIILYFYMHLCFFNRSWQDLSLFRFGFFCLFALATLCGMWDLSSPTRNQTHIPCIGSTES